MKNRKRCSKRRLLLRIFILGILFIILWYGVVRLISPWRALKVVDAGQNAMTLTVEHDRPLRIAAYNIAHGRGTARSNFSDKVERRQRLDDIGKLLRELDADVVVLNEVDFSSIWSGHENQADTIATAAGYRYRAEEVNIDASLPFASLRFGNAVLSRYPIVEAEVINLTGFAGWETVLGGKKRAVLCVIEREDGSRFRVVGAHLEPRGEEAFRVRSVKEVVLALKYPYIPTIIAGDLNATLPGLPGARVTDTGVTSVSTLMTVSSFSAAPGDNESYSFEPTFPSWVPDRTIDWILVGSLLQIDRLEVKQSDLSDHLPIVAHVKWMGKTED